VLFDVQTLRRDGWTVLAVVGDVDLATIPALKQQADHAEGDQIALDLSGVDHLDPTALGIVLSLQLRCRRRGSRFLLLCPPGRPREVVAELGLDRIVDVADSLPPAL
jgi:anti-anti-sigma factor